MSIWSQLPRELELRIISFVHPNDMAGTMRLVCKGAAALIGGPRHTVIRLSQRVPPHAFAHRWGQPGAMRSLTYKQRLRLLCLTAASGSIPNLEFLLPRVGCLPTAEVLAAAAAAGHLSVCQWLRHRDCPWDTASAYQQDAVPWSWSLDVASAAGGANRREVCEWLMAECCPHAASSAACGAAGGGHVGLLEWLMPRAGVNTEHFLAILRCRLAEGCDPATLQRLHAAGPGGWAEQLGFGPEAESGAMMVDAAAGSPTPDWREKVEWLEAAGYARGRNACTAAAERPDALQRLAWLRARGFPPVLHANSCMSWVTSRADLEALEGLPGEGGGWRLVGRGACALADSALDHGRLELLQALRERGLLDHNDATARHGHLPVVAWMVDTWGAEEILTSWLFQDAAVSGSVELMAWLRERGCPWDDGAYQGAAEAGCEAALEWLAEGGCPLQGAAEAYVGACRNGDLATLACLRRLGCPITAGAFTEAIAHYACPPAALRWLVDNGCPVDWAAALAVARDRHPAGSAAAAWLEEEGRRRQAAAGRVHGGSGA